MRVLVTAGQVYGNLDANKVVGNRTRGIWAAKFAKFLVESGYEVTLLIPDTWTQDQIPFLPFPVGTHLEVVKQRGYFDYARKCVKMAQTHDAAIMAAAVVNWIPKDSISGKMQTKGFREGDVIHIPFVLAPRVINRMKAENPHLTLIGCKLLVGATQDELVDAAYDVVLAARCNAVVANDLSDLRVKHLVYQDRTVVVHNDDFTALFHDLQNIIEDEHFRTVETEDRISVLMSADPLGLVQARARFDAIVDLFRERFLPRQGTSVKVFGAVAVPIPNIGWLVSPREKGGMFSSRDAVIVTRVGKDGDNTVTVLKGHSKATLNAPLLVRALEAAGPDAVGVLHLHEQLPDVPTTRYAPPGTVRDSLRPIPGRTFNIEGHGFVAALGGDLGYLK